MRFNQFKYLLILAVASMALVQCDRLEETDTPYEGESFYRFDNASSSLSESCPNPSEISVTFTSTDGSAGSAEFTVEGGTEGVDYTLPNGNTLEFNADNGFQDVAEIVPVNNDEFGEDLVLTVSLTNSAGGRVGFPGPDALNSTHDLVIINDDCQGDEFEIGGFYNALANGQSTDGCCPDPTTVNSTVSIAPLGDGAFFLNDFTGGLYVEWYDVYGITSQDQTPIVFEFDPCTSGITEQAGSTEPFGTAVTLTGSYDKCTGTIQFTWVNGFSDQGTIVLTPM